ncbi:MAG TPA: c-type cytochrome [Burkholderiaceae bacterium]|nr:c-type cytochrome [Burkholderiaceae bacterium]
MKPIHALGVLLALAATGAQAQQDAGPQALYVKSLAATCANCHGTDGRAVQGSAVPTLAGMPRAYIAEQMKAFKAGTRPATVMHQLAKGYSDAQIEAIAGYFAAQPRQ